MPTARLARPADLPTLLALFAASEVSRAVEPRERAEDLWRETMAHPGVHVFVSDACGRIAATCMLITAPNLLRGGRRHGFLENVVTHPGHRGRGHGRAVVEAALARAWADDCHHVLVQSGRADPRVHGFYRRARLRAGPEGRLCRDPALADRGMITASRTVRPHLARGHLSPARGRGHPPCTAARRPYL